jgi:hypothetical protein
VKSSTNLQCLRSSRQIRPAKNKSRLNEPPPARHRDLLTAPPSVAHRRKERDARHIKMQRERRKRNSLELCRGPTAATTSARRRLPYAQRHEKEMAWRGRPAGRASMGAGCSAPTADPLARVCGGASSLHERRGELLHPGRSA